MSGFLHSQVLRGLVSLAVLFPLFAGALLPQPPVSFAHGTDIIAHWSGFFMVSIVMFAILRDRIILTLICLSGLAVVLEAAQIFLDARHVSAADMTANLLGVLCAFAVVGLFRVSRLQTSRMQGWKKDKLRFSA